MQHSNNKFRESFEKSPIGTLFFDMEGKLTDANQSALKIGGIPLLNDVLGLNIFNDIHIGPIKDELLQKGYIKIQVPFDFDYFKKLGIYNPTRSGTAFIDLTVSVIDSGFLVQIQDITEQKMTEEALLENEKVYREFFDNPLNGFALCEIITDNDGNPADFVYLEVNPAFELFTGLKREDVVNKKVTDVLDPEEVAEIIQIYGKVALIGESAKFQYPIPSLDKWFEVAAFSPRKNQFIAFFTDITERKKTEEALKESETQFRTLIQDLEPGVALMDGTGKFMIINPSFMRMFGLDPELSILNIYSQDWSLWEVYGEDNKLLHVDEHPVRKAVLTHKSVRNQVVSVRNPGANELTWMLISAEPILNEDGTINRIIATYYDITERKKLEEELRHARDHLELQVKERTEQLNIERQRLFDMLESLPVMICLLTEDYHVSFANRAFRDRFGEAKGRHCYEYLFSFYEPCYWCQAYQVLETGKPHYWELETPDGSFIDVYNMPFTDVDGSPLILEMDIDVTEQKINERELKRSKEDFRRLAENSPDNIIRLDKNLRYVYVNSAAAQITGNSPDDFIGKTYEDLGIPGKYITVWRENNLKAIQTGEIQHYEFEFRVNNHLRFIESVAIPEFSANGEIESVLVLDRDITERKNAEKQLKELIKELERSNKELQQFAYVSSHDLQEPLRTIASFTQLLERRYKGQLDSDADEFIDFIVDAAVRMKHQIEDLLEFSRVETKGGEFKPIDMNFLLKKVIQSLNSSVEESKAEIMIDELPNVIGDAGQLQRVFQNLISNAIKFRKPDEPPKIHISAYKSDDGSEYVFSVADNGIGIEEQYFDRIFTIFQKLHTRDEYKGTGIGLSIVKRIIERHRGHIWVESEYGVGSTFYFTIPIKDYRIP